MEREYFPEANREQQAVAVECPLAGRLAEELRQARAQLVHRWLERIAARVSMDPQHVFPTQALLDHVPILLDGMADYIEDPAEEISADIPIVAKAMELGKMRHDQGFDVHEILKEYEILGGIIFHHLIDIIDDVEDPCTRGELFSCAHRLFRAVAVVQQVTTDHYLRVAAEGVKDREDRLRAFNRVLSHELKNRIGAVMGANELLEGAADLDQELRQRMLRIVSENTRQMRGIIDNLVNLTRLDRDARKQKHVRLPQAAAEVARQLREAAAARAVQIRLHEDLPAVEVNAAAVELCLSNYVSNGIKYADPAKPERWIEITGRTEEDAERDTCNVVVTVQDNGLGVPEAARSRLFRRFFRAHEQTVTGVEGTGLGLSIVRETIESVGGKAWAEFPGEGSLFAFSIPIRRDQDDEFLAEVDV
ncbi:MAG: ATP-binding protein [Gemmatimonadota bacterium]